MTHTKDEASMKELQRYSPDGEGGMELDSLGAYVKLQDVTTPPAAQRQWVDLTDEQRSAIIRHHSFAENIIRVTAAKLKELNT